jgi:hypothetical protein
MIALQHNEKPTKGIIVATVLEQSQAMSNLPIPTAPNLGHDLESLGALITNTLGDTQSAQELHQVIDAARQASDALALALQTIDQKAKQVAERLLNA